MISSNLTGFLLAVISSAFIGSSFIIKKKGLQLARVNGLRAGVGGYGYLLQPLWWVGMVTMIVGEIANFVAYMYASAVLVTPLGALSIIVSAVLAHFLLKETLQKMGMLGCLLCIVGSTIIVLHAPQEMSLTSVQQIWGLAIQPAFLLYTASVIAVTLFLVLYCAPRFGQTNILVYIGVCSIIGSLTVMSVKAIGIAIKLTLEGANQFFYFQTWIFTLVAITCIIVQLNYLNMALDNFNTAVVSPIHYALFTAFTILASAMMFKDYSGQSISSIVSELCGFITILSGTTLLHSTREPDPPDMTEERFPPNNVVLTLARAGLLWLGWAGFNGGGPYSANIDSSMAVINTNICAATRLLVWTWLDVIFFKKPSVIGAVQGMITGLVCITPGAGLVQGWAAIVMGVLSGSVPWYSMMVLGKKSTIFQKVDDTLAVFHTHAEAGLLGSILTGLFAEPQLSTLFLPVTNSKGGVYGGPGGIQILKQIVGALFIIGWNIVATSIICFVISFIVPLRMTEEELLIGDDAVHGEEAYALWGDGEKLSLFKDDTPLHGMASSGATQVV